MSLCKKCGSYIAPSIAFTDKALLIRKDGYHYNCYVQLDDFAQYLLWRKIKKGIEINEFRSKNESI